MDENEVPTWTILRDGLTVTTVAGASGMLRYFHKTHSYSASHAVAHEGYTVLDENGEKVSV